MAKPILFNTTAIISKIKKCKNEKNLPEKTRMIMQGAAVGTPELISEIKAIIAADVKVANKMLNDVSAALKKS